jgi:hypothetical protein
VEDPAAAGVGVVAGDGAVDQAQVALAEDASALAAGGVAGDGAVDQPQRAGAQEDAADTVGPCVVLDPAAFEDDTGSAQAQPVPAVAGEQAVARAQDAVVADDAGIEIIRKRTVAEAGAAVRDVDAVFGVVEIGRASCRERVS